MSEFKRLQNAFAEMREFVAQLEANQVEDIEARKCGIDKVIQTIDEWEDKVEKHRKKANEKDKDKQVYGESMVQRVLAFLAEWDPFVAAARQWADRIELEYIPHRCSKEAAAEAERQLKEQQELEARLREEEKRRRAAEEAQREAEEKERKEKERQDALQAQKEAAERAARLAHEEELQRRSDLAAYLAANSAGQVLLDSVRMLEASSKGDRRLFEMVLRATYGVISNVISYPDEEQFKVIRKSNVRFHEDIGRYPGAIGCLFAVGFREKYEENETLLVLQEPDVVEAYDKWKDWFDEASEMKLRIEKVFEGLTEERYTHRPLDLLHILSKD